LVVRVGVGDDGGRRDLGAGATGGRDREERLHRRGERRATDAEEIVLRTAAKLRDDGDALRRIDGAAAADGDDEVRAGVVHRRDAAVNLGDRRVGGDVVVDGV